MAWTIVADEKLRRNRPVPTIKDWQKSKSLDTRLKHLGLPLQIKVEMKGGKARKVAQEKSVDESPLEPYESDVEEVTSGGRKKGEGTPKPSKNIPGSSKGDAAYGSPLMDYIKKPRRHYSSSESSSSRSRSSRRSSTPPSIVLRKSRHHHHRSSKRTDDAVKDDEAGPSRDHYRRHRSRDRSDSEESPEENSPNRRSRSRSRDHQRRHRSRDRSSPEDISPQRRPSSRSRDCQRRHQSRDRSHPKDLRKKRFPKRSSQSRGRSTDRRGSGKDGSRSRKDGSHRHHHHPEKRDKRQRSKSPPHSRRRSAKTSRRDKDDARRTLSPDPKPHRRTESIRPTKRPQTPPRERSLNLSRSVSPNAQDIPDVSLVDGNEESGVSGPSPRHPLADSADSIVEVPMELEKTGDPAALAATTADQSKTDLEDKDNEGKPDDEKTEASASADVLAPATDGSQQASLAEITPSQHEIENREVRVGISSLLKTSNTVVVTDTSNKASDIVLNDPGVTTEVNGVAALKSAEQTAEDVAQVIQEPSLISVATKNVEDGQIPTTSSSSSTPASAKKKRNENVRDGAASAVVDEEESSPEIISSVGLVTQRLDMEFFKRMYKEASDGLWPPAGLDFCDIFPAVLQWLGEFKDVTDWAKLCPKTGEKGSSNFSDYDSKKITHLLFPGEIAVYSKNPKFVHYFSILKAKEEGKIVKKPLTHAMAHGQIPQKVGRMFTTGKCASLTKALLYRLLPCLKERADPKIVLAEHMDVIEKQLNENVIWQQVPTLDKKFVVKGAFPFALTNDMPIRRVCDVTIAEKVAAASRAAKDITGDSEPTRSLKEWNELIARLQAERQENRENQTNLTQLLKEEKKKGTELDRALEAAIKGRNVEEQKEEHWKAMKNIYGSTNEGHQSLIGMGRLRQKIKAKSATPQEIASFFAAELGADLQDFGFIAPANLMDPSRSLTKPPKVASRSLVPAEKRKKAESSGAETGDGKSSKDEELHCDGKLSGGEARNKTPRGTSKVSSAAEGDAGKASGADRSAGSSGSSGSSQSHAAAAATSSQVEKKGSSSREHEKESAGEVVE